MCLVENSQLNIQLKEGNPAAFEELFKYTFARMLNYCRLFIQDLDQGNDLVQEFFVRLWEKRSTIKPTNSIENLLFVMPRNRCLIFFCDQNMQSIAKTSAQLAIMYISGFCATWRLARNGFPIRSGAK
ncbi:MAG: hypothetical protein WAO52_09290 [Prolixibacteraceae bacterium]